MKKYLIGLFAIICITCNAQTTPFVGFSGGFMSNNKGYYGFELGAEMSGFILAGDIRLQSSSDPVLLGIKTGWYKPLDDCQCGYQALSIMGGVYAAKRDQDTKYHVSELAVTGTVRYYFKRYFFIEGTYQFQEEQYHSAGIGFGIMGWFDK